MISTQRRKTDQDQGLDDQNPVFDQFSQTQLAPEDPEIVAQRARAQGKSDPNNTADVKVDLTELWQTVQTLQAQVAEKDRALEALTMPQTQVALPDPPKEVSYDGLPNPTIDPEGYARELQARIQKNFEDKQRFQAQQGIVAQSRQEKYDALLDDFEDRYEGYTEDMKRLEFVVRSVVDTARGRGLDIDRYMFGTRDRFMRDVAKEYDAVFGSPDGGEEEPTIRQTRQRKVARKTLDDDDIGRSAGIFSGQEGGGSPTRTRQSQDKPADMIAELQELQRKSGFW